MKPGERNWALKYGIALGLLCSVPYLVGYFREDSRWVFSGFVLGVEDGNSYIAKMLLGSYGAWLFRTPYTLIQQSGEIAFLPYLLLGKLAHPPALHVQLVSLYQLFRFIVTPFTVFAIYRFSTLFLDGRGWRRWVTVLATLGGGLGWILPLFGRTELLGSLPLDFISPESFGFLAFLGLPHLILARGIMFSALYAYLEDGRSQARSYRSGILLLVLALIQSLSTLSALAVIFFHQGLMLIKNFRAGELRRRWLLAGLRAVAPSVPLISYFVVRFSSDPFLRAWTAQNRIYSPHPIHYLLAYGVLFIPVLVGIVKKLRVQEPRWVFLVGWIFVAPVLAYFPHNLQRRLVEGIWIVLLIITAYSLELLPAKLLRPIRTLASVLMIISPVLLFSGAIQVALNPERPVFLKAEHVQGFSWMQENAPVGSAVLADYPTSNALPAWAPVNVVLGHGPESVGFEDLEPQVEAFFTGRLAEGERDTWLTALGVDFLIITKPAGGDGNFEPKADNLLLNVYENGGLVIYEVQRGQD